MLILKTGAALGTIGPKRAAGMACPGRRLRTTNCTWLCPNPLCHQTMQCTGPGAALIPGSGVTQALQRLWPPARPCTEPLACLKLREHGGAILGPWSSASACDEAVHRALQLRNPHPAESQWQCQVLPSKQVRLLNSVYTLTH